MTFDDFISDFDHAKMNKYKNNHKFSTLRSD